jgi:hypothetical protein
MGNRTVGARIRWPKIDPDEVAIVVKDGDSAGADDPRAVHPRNGIVGEKCKYIASDQTAALGWSQAIAQKRCLLRQQAAR